jgi:hypothetical protein
MIEPVRRERVITPEATPAAGLSVSLRTSRAVATPERTIAEMSEIVDGYGAHADQKSGASSRPGRSIASE